MRKRNIIFTTAVVALLAVAAVPLVYGGPHGPRGRHGASGAGDFGLGPIGHLEHAKEMLGLSDQQVGEIKTIFTDLRAKNSTYRDQMHQGIGGIVDTLIANPANVAGAQVLLDQQEAAERTMKRNLLDAASKALSVLTPEQRTKLGALAAEHRARLEKRRG